MSDEIKIPETFADLMPDGEPRRISLRQLLRQERQREGRTGQETWIKNMVKRGGFEGQFEDNP